MIFKDELLYYKDIGAFVFCLKMRFLRVQIHAYILTYFHMHTIIAAQQFCNCYLVK